jgi:hypothetical protein
LNQAEHFFAEVTTKPFRRRAFRSVRQHDQAIYDYLEEYNAKPKPLSMDRHRGPHIKDIAGVGHLGQKKTDDLILV